MVSVIDSHLHVVSADTARYPLQPGGLGRDWWTGRPVDAGHITSDLDAAGVERGVIVQAVGPYRNDNRYARAAVAGDPGRFALVGAIDATGDDPGAELGELVAPGDVAGVRVFAAGGDASVLSFMLNGLLDFGPDDGLQCWRIRSVSSRGMRPGSGSGPGGSRL